MESLYADEAAVVARLNSLLDGCQKSPYYRDALPASRIDSLRDFERFPFLTADLLRAHTPPQSFDLLAGRPNGAFVFSTGGTTGIPKYTYRNLDDFGENHFIYDALEVGPDDVAANLFMPGIWGAYTNHEQGLMQRRCVIVPIGGFGLEEPFLDASLQTMVDTGVNFLIGVPSAIVHFAQVLERRRADYDIKITKVCVCGEVMYDSVYAYLREVLHEPRIISFYSSVDCSVMGVQSLACEPRDYHLLDHVYMELVDDEGRPVRGANRRGHVVITLMKDRLLPIVRYKIGDAAMFYEPSQADEHGRLKFKVLGRSDDIVIVASVHITMGAIMKAISTVDKMSPHAQVTLRRRNYIDHLTITVETNGRLSDEEKEARAGRVLAQLLRDDSHLKDAADSGKCNPVVVDVVDPQTIPRNPKTGKIKRIVDLRE